MNPRVWFVTPVHGRSRLTAICLRQLRRTCDTLTSAGIDATAVVIGADENLDTAHGLGFATVRRSNDFLGRKFNDGSQLALDPTYNPAPADYVIPCGSDDWIDHRALLDLPADDTIVCFRRSSIVREDGQEIATVHSHYPGGIGLRIYPRQLLEPLGYRPADEDRRRGCDTSILCNLQAVHGNRIKLIYRNLHERQVVDWKTADCQLNPYQRAARLRRAERSGDPFAELEGVYPAEGIREMRDLYTQAAAA